MRDKADVALYCPGVASSLSGTAIAADRCLVAAGILALSFCLLAASVWLREQES